MSHLAFVAPPFLGHLNPMAALAQELVRRGHRATFLHMADAGPLLAARGHAFHAIGERSHPPGSLRGILRRMGSIDGVFGLGGVIRDVTAATDMLCRDLPAALRRIGADALVCDQAEAAGGLVARHLGLPFVSVANALPLNREPEVPPPFTGWRYDPSPWGIERNKGGYRVSDWLMRRHGELIAGHAARWKLGDMRSIESCASPYAEISQLVAGVDMPRRHLAETFHYCGPLREPRPAAAVEFRMPPPDGGRLVYASLGTLQGGRIGLFKRIAEAAGRSGVQLILAHGGGLRPDQVAGLPGRPHVFDFVPQGEVLREASLAILNGGLNTVMDALAAGVPAIVLPIGFEQAAIGRRLERVGAGAVVRHRFLTTRRLARTIGDVLDDGRYRGAALRLRDEIAVAGGVGRAADIVEAVVATGRPVGRRDPPRSPAP